MGFHPACMKASRYSPRQYDSRNGAFIDFSGIKYLQVLNASFVIPAKRNNIAVIFTLGIISRREPGLAVPAMFMIV